MTTIQIELPEATALAARDAGLLTPQALERLINDALRRKQAGGSLLSGADRVGSGSAPPLPREDAGGSFLPGSPAARRATSRLRRDSQRDQAAHPARAAARRPGRQLRDGSALSGNPP